MGRGIGGGAGVMPLSQSSATRGEGFNDLGKALRDSDYS